MILKKLLNTSSVSPSLRHPDPNDATSLTSPRMVYLAFPLKCPAGANTSVLLVKMVNVNQLKIKRFPSNCKIHFTERKKSSIKNPGTQEICRRMQILPTCRFPHYSNLNLPALSQIDIRKICISHQKWLR